MTHHPPLARSAVFCFVCLGLCLGITAWGHFLVLLPSAAIVDEHSSRQLELLLTFTHPMTQGPRMDLAKPRRFGVRISGKTLDLIDTLKEAKEGDKRYYRSEYRVTGPGDHTFFVEPAPYWEPAEGKWIIHYTKVIVDGLGAEESWDKPLGLPVEIQPLVRPYGLWTGNLFRGVVLQDGQPVPYATIEVAYYNEGAKVKLPKSAFETQVIKADANGVFAYAMPRAGWWGFAALVDGPNPMRNPAGQEVPVELGGLLWVQTQDMEP
jgi:cobalt/nickel transport protein